ncbi:5703_t:CDS:2 [Funneliformis caledonium]|uniref:5703_t:CDS:1 n=1 Tax=Funneliformis caledonium TaxID=1117310 RepID=A0A9N9A9V0_9GLOM|nr:5703_t:CDS:2 [Funneliformis caledonium]
MPRLKGDFWQGYDIQLNSQEKQHYKCKTCGKHFITKMMAADQKELESLFTHAIYSTGIPFNILENKNMKAFFVKACPLFKLPICQSLSTTLLDQEYILKIDWAKSILEKGKEVIQYFRNHQIPLATLYQLQLEKYGRIIALVLIIDIRWKSAFYYIDHILQTKAALQSILGEEIEINKNIVLNLSSESFWKDLKDLHNLLKPFVIFINQLKSDKLFLSLAFVKLRELESEIKNNAIIPKQVQDDVIDFDKIHNVIEEEIIRLAGKENASQVLNELAEYVSQTGGFAKRHFQVALKILLIPATSAASEQNWSAFSLFILNYAIDYIMKE